MAASILAARTGRATPPGPVTPEVSLDLQRCPRFARPEIVRLLGLELDARVVPPGGGGPHATRGVIACSAQGVRLEVSDPLAGTFLSRTLPPATTDASAAPRIAALALAELVFASWLELAQPRPQAIAGEAPPHELRRAALERAQRHASVPAAPAAAERTPSPPAEIPAAEAPPTAAPIPAAPLPAVSADGSAPPFRPDRAYVLALAQATGPFRGIGVAWGGGVRAGWSSGATLFTAASAPVGWAGDVELTTTWTDVDSTAGSVRVSLWSAAPRGSLRLNLGSRGNAWIDVGVGARLGVARLAGAPTDPATFRGGSLAGTWGGATAHAGSGLAIGAFVIALGCEAGQVLRTVSGDVDGQSPVAVAGHWLSGSLALGWGP